MNEFLKLIMAFALGFLLCQYTHDAQAQTYAVQNQQGYVQGYIQQNGNTVNVLTPNGNTVGQPLTVYPTQLTMPSGAAIGTPSYSVPPSPPSPPSPRVLQ